MQRRTFQKQIGITILSVIGLAGGLIGCSEISEWNRRETLLKQMVKTNAAELQVYRQIPTEWVVYEKATEKGMQFGDSLMSYSSADLKKAQAGWQKCDRALWHTTESVVTIVFIKSNSVTDYYLGVR